MKFLHLSDLHIGKKVNGFSMLEDQKFILDRILEITDAERPDGVLIAGDVYDKSIPPEEAVGIFDDFLYELSRRSVPVFIVSGNHDSAERVAFGSRLMAGSGVRIAPVYDGHVSPIRLNDEYGPVDVYLLPFLRPAQVRALFPEEKIESTADAVACAVRHMDADTTCRNVLVAHQFVTGGLRSDSEEAFVGGTDNVDAAVFAPFDYTALGHLHAPQCIGSAAVRYCGSPLKYSFSEFRDKKSVTVAELGPRGSLNVRTVDLVPLRDMGEVKGFFDDVILGIGVPDGLRDQYVRVTLYDENDVPNALNDLRNKYPYLMQMNYENSRTALEPTVIGAEEPERKTPEELFGELYLQMNGSEMTDEQAEFLHSLIEEIWGNDQ